MKPYLFLAFSIFVAAPSWTQTISESTTVTKSPLAPCEGKEYAGSIGQEQLHRYSVKELPGNKIIQQIVEQSTEVSRKFPDLSRFHEDILKSNLADKYSTRIAIMASVNFQTQSSLLGTFASKNNTRPKDLLPWIEPKLIEYTDLIKGKFPEHPMILKDDSGTKIKIQDTEMMVGGGKDFSGQAVPKNQAIYKDSNRNCWTVNPPTTKPSSSPRLFNYEGFTEVAKLEVSKQRVCSAVVVGPRLALTARHCVQDGLLLAVPKNPSCDSPEGQGKCEYLNRPITKLFTWTATFSNLSAFSFVVRSSPDIALLSWAEPVNVSFPEPTAYNQLPVGNIDNYVRAGFGYTERTEAVYLTIGGWSSQTSPEMLQRKDGDQTNSIGYLRLNLGKTASKICRNDSGGPVYLGNPNGYEAKRQLIGVVSKSHMGDQENCSDSQFELHALISEPIRRWICSTNQSLGGAKC